MVDRNDLAIPDYDQLPTGTLQHRIRSLTVGQVEQLLDYERGHGNRTPVVEILTARVGQLDAGQTPSPGGRGTQPERPGPPDAGSPVSPATSGPAVNPPPHGEPDQPARPKGDRP